MQSKITGGLPRMHLEAAEKREFLPEFIEDLHKFGCQIVLEKDYGSGMGFTQDDYLRVSPTLKFSVQDETCRQDIVIVLRYPEINRFPACAAEPA